MLTLMVTASAGAAAAACVFAAAASVEDADEALFPEELPEDDAAGEDVELPHPINKEAATAAIVIADTTRFNIFSSHTNLSFNP